MKLLLTLFLLLTISACQKPVADGAFVGKWYVLNFMEGQEHWEITDKNKVFITDLENDTTLMYSLKYSWLGEEYYMVSSDQSDTIRTTWLEVSEPFPPTTPLDTIRFYHYFVMVRDKQPPATDLSNKKIVELLENSSWSYQNLDNTVIYLLTDSVNSDGEKKALLKIQGCFEYSSNEGYWNLDTLSNNLVLKVNFDRFGDQMMIKKVSDSAFIADRDEYYWFRRNVKVKKIDPKYNFPVQSKEFDYSDFYNCFKF